VNASPISGSPGLGAEAWDFYPEGDFEVVFEGTSGPLSVAGCVWGIGRQRNEWV
jgi:hypothetical protein